MKNISKIIAIAGMILLANTALAFNPFAFAGVTDPTINSQGVTSSTSFSSSNNINQNSTVVGNNNDVVDQYVGIGSQDSVEGTTIIANTISSTSFSSSNNINQNSTVIGSNNTVNQNGTLITDIEYIAPIAPINDLNITTSSASSIEETRATLRGQVSNENNIKTWFAFSKTDRSPECTDSSERIRADSNVDDGETFSQRVSNLRNNTIYYFRACGENRNGNVERGSVRSFKTDRERDARNQNCSVNGEFVAHGDAERFFSRTSVNHNQSCSSYDQVRTCNNGNMSGSSSFRFNSCSRDNEQRNDLNITTSSASSIEETRATLRGQVSNENNIKTWFAFSKTDRSPECTDSSERIRADSNVDDGETFSQRVSNLRNNTIYYFRACGENRNGNVERGSVRSFKTDRERNERHNNAEVETNSPTRIRALSAQLNGSIVINDTRDPRVHFIFGKSSSRMNDKTTDLRVNNDTYFQAIQGLNQNTKYYYRAVVTDRNGNVIDRGVIRSFVTEKITTNIETSATTLSASPSFTVATLFGRVDGGDGSVICYFEYGRSASLGLKSSSYLTSSRVCSRVIRGLRSGEKYYYRVVIKDNGIKHKGNIKSFRQKTSGIVAPRDNVIVTLEKEVIEAVALQINKQVSQEQNSGYGIEVNAMAGDVLFYKVRVINTTDKKMKNVVVTDTIPGGLELSEGSSYNIKTKYITSKIGNLYPGESRVFVTEMTVSSNVIVGDIIRSTADVKFENETNTTNSVIINIVSEKLEEGINQQEASIFGAGAFLPNTLLGWLGIIFLISLIAFLISKLLSSEKTSKVKLEELRILEEKKMNK